MGVLVNQIAFCSTTLFHLNQPIHRDCYLCLRWYLCLLVTTLPFQVVYIIFQVVYMVQSKRSTASVWLFERGLPWLSKRTSPSTINVSYTSLSLSFSMSVRNVAYRVMNLVLLPQSLSYPCVDQYMNLRLVDSTTSMFKLLLPKKGNYVPSVAQHLVYSTTNHLWIYSTNLFLLFLSCHLQFTNRAIPYHLVSGRTRGTCVYIISKLTLYHS